MFACACEKEKNKLVHAYRVCLVLYMWDSVTYIWGGGGGGGGGGRRWTAYCVLVTKSSK